MDARNRQVGGSHYKDMAIQPLDFILANKLGFCEGNAVKYVCRHRRKNGRQDIEKAIHYLQRLIEEEYPDAPAGGTCHCTDPTLGCREKRSHDCETSTGDVPVEVRDSLFETHVASLDCQPEEPR